LLILFLILLAVSFMKIAEESILADIFDPGPCRASRKREWMREGFAKRNRAATSLVTRK
jgi:hypothetical protein